ncbi:SRPBCC domain-containing protein [Leptobacterium flavescens]|uniref:SRPBCC domain-containing protein n=1 Tax=Leptobacterium flavescens TaxID=472055 RepID=A0A6P0UPY9_9FLAO|nr:SRPBCC domain-containing protein [Leptobacterium flavescens]NER15027.1 SRPBCC domain-containing protein [Leptobacterium flavescens]
MKTTDQPVIVEQVFKISIDELWDSITQLPLMKQWFFENIEEFEAEVGFSTRFNVHSEGRDFLHLWEITEADAPRKIVYNWKYEGYEGDSFVSFELFEQKGGSKLRLTHRVTQDFTSDVPEFNRDSCLNGWKYFISGNLKDFLES